MGRPLRRWGGVGLLCGLPGALPAAGPAGWGLVLPCGPPGALPAAGPAEEEHWEAVPLDGARVGSVHTVVEQLADGKTTRATADLQLAFRRQGALVRLRMEQGTEEAGGVV